MGKPRAWLVAGDAKEHLTRAIAEYSSRLHGSTVDGEPFVMNRRMLGDDGFVVENTVVFVADDEGRWQEHARAHNWTPLSVAHMREFLAKGESIGD